MFWLCLQTICAVRQNGLFGPRAYVRVELFALLLFAVNVLRLVRVLRLLLRGLFGRSFQHATVPLPVPSWTPADRKVRPRSGAIRPTPIKSIRSSCGTPSRSIIRITPGRNGQVKGTHRAGREPQVFARRKAANQHRHMVERFLRFWSWMLYLRNLTRRIGQRWEPTRAPRQGSKRNEGGPLGSPLFFAPSCHSSLSLHALNPSGARGTPPDKHCLQSAVSCRRPFKRLEFLVLLDRRIVAVLLLLLEHVPEDRRQAPHHRHPGDLRPATLLDPLEPGRASPRRIAGL